VNLRAETLKWLVPLLLLSQPALGGGESSGGHADDYKLAPAFFLAWESADVAKPIDTCYDAIAGFGITDDVLLTSIQESFQAWTDYVATKHVSEFLGGPWLRTKLSLHRGCNGTEEFRVYFGVSNTDVTPFLQGASRTFGLAGQVTSGPGILWIAPPQSIDSDDNSGKLPNWSAKTVGAFRGLMLHEMGHVFGNDHVDGTVMSHEIGHYLANDTSSSPSSSDVALYSKIDAVRELIFCQDCKTEYVAAARFDNITHADSDWEHSFETLVGRKSIPPLLISYERSGSFDGSGVLSFKDAAGTYAFTVAPQNRDLPTKDSAHLFEGLGGKFFQSVTTTYFANLVPARGTRTAAHLPLVLLTYNKQDVMVEIVPLGGPELDPRPLFISNAIADSQRESGRSR
jgi:hypothetical protein